MSNLNLNKIAGEAPNEVWLRTGQLFVLFGVVAYLGFSGFGLKVGEHTVLAPFVVILSGVVMMLGGTRLKEKKLIAEQAHELAMEKAKNKTPG